MVPQGMWFSEVLVLSDLGNRASRAIVLANAAGDAGILVNHGGDVLKLENALGAVVDADTTGDALVGINNGMGHSIPPLIALDAFGEKHIEFLMA